MTFEVITRHTPCNSRVAWHMGRLKQHCNTARQVPLHLFGNNITDIVNMHVRTFCRRCAPRGCTKRGGRISAFGHHGLIDVRTEL